jgi:DNA polymerase V
VRLEWPACRFAKAGVVLLDIQPTNREQFELDLGEPVAERDRSRLMKPMDSVNDRWGKRKRKGTVKVGSGKVGEAPRDWGMRQDRETPGYND